MRRHDILLRGQVDATFPSTGAISPAPRGRKPYGLAEHEAVVRELVSAHPDLTLDDLTRELAACGIRIGRPSVNRFLQACQLTPEAV